MLIYIIIAILVLIGVGAVIYLFLLKKQQGAQTTGPQELASQNLDNAQDVPGPVNIPPSAGPINQPPFPPSVNDISGPAIASSQPSYGPLSTASESPLEPSKIEIESAQPNPFASVVKKEEPLVPEENKTQIEPETPVLPGDGAILEETPPVDIAAPSVPEQPVSSEPSVTGPEPESQNEPVLDPAPTPIPEDEGKTPEPPELKI